MKPCLKNCLLSLVSIMTVFLLLEVLLALFSPHKIKVRPYHEKYDPNLGWINQPLKNEGVQFEFARNRFFHVTHNSLGLRGPETTYKKPDGVKRILFVGDSYFWGYGVSDDEVISSALLKQLPQNFEVLNGGTTGYGTDQLLLWLRHEGLKFRPDMVIFSFSAANDLDEISSSISYNYPKPIFMLENEAVALKNVPVPRTEETDRKTFGNPKTFFGKLKKFLRHHTHTYPFIAGRLNSKPAIRNFLIDTGLAEEYTKRLGNIPVFTNPAESLWEIAISLIKESNKISTDAGAEFALFFIPSKERDPSGRIIMEGARENIYANNSDISSMLKQFAARENIAYLDFLPVSREHLAKGNPLYNPDKTDHHWNVAGHRVAAGAVLSFLKEHRWL